MKGQDGTAGRAGHSLTTGCPQEKSSAPALQVSAATAEIEFRDVSFKYINGKPIFTNLNFRIPPGKKIGIVGGSGSG